LKLHSKTAAVFLTLFIALTILLSYTKAQSNLIVTSANFNIYFPNGSTLAFQHPATALTKETTITLTVTSGTLNATSATLRMWESTGKLTFTATDNATITLTGTGINTRINGERAYTASIVQGNTYTIEWGFSEPQFWLPVLFIIGMLGLGCLMGGPLYIIQKIKEHKYYPDMMNGITITIIGFAFFIAWLWG
jgi:hypothetical protein